MIEVKPIDRTHAGQLAHKVYGKRIALAIMSGENDSHHFIQAFAEFRSAVEKQEAGKCQN